MITVKYRRILLALVILALTPLVWMREGKQEVNNSTLLSYERIEVAQADLGNGLEILAAFDLNSPNSHFGGFSALTFLPDGKFFTASDQGSYLSFSPTQLLRAKPLEEGVITAPKFARVSGKETTDKTLVDIEAATSDPARGLMWFAYEGTNSIERRAADLSGTRRVEPAGMEEFNPNSGPEAFVRLKNGRFIMLSEGHDSNDATHPARYFDGDPVEGAKPVPFLFQPIPEYRPVDMAELPDGRVLILHRRVIPGFIPSLSSKIMLADPADIAAGNVWYGKEIATIASPNPIDNFEGIAIYERKDGAIGIWLISDDNQSRFMRTLMMQLRWDIPPALKKVSAKQGERAQ